MCFWNLLTFMRDVRETLAPLWKVVVDADKEDLEEILRQTLMDLDAAFCRHWRLKKQLAPGSTATVALIRGGYELVTGHIGKAFKYYLNDLTYRWGTGCSLSDQLNIFPVKPKYYDIFSCNFLVFGTCSVYVGQN